MSSTTSIFSFGNQDSIQIAAYSHEMRKDVIALICEEYGSDPTSEEERFVRYYDHPFQRDQAIRLVAMDGARVVGFQSLVSWPFQNGSTQLRSLQLGSIFVAKNCRGRGLFGRMLRHQEAVLEKSKIDFLVGFPVNILLGSYVRDQWLHLFDLSWYARLVHPTSILKRVELALVESKFDMQPMHVDQLYPEQAYTLSSEPLFMDWRSQFRKPGTHFYFNHSLGGADIRFDLRLEQRGRANILVIGAIISNSADPAVLKDGLRQLFRAAKAHQYITMVAIALNPYFGNETLCRLLRLHLFFPLKAKAHFIVKDMQQQNAKLHDRTKWQLFRGDMDTW